MNNKFKFLENKKNNKKLENIYNFEIKTYDTNYNIKLDLYNHIININKNNEKKTKIY